MYQSEQPDYTFILPATIYDRRFTSIIRRTCRDPSRVNLGCAGDCDRCSSYSTRSVRSIIISRHLGRNRVICIISTTAAHGCRSNLILIRVRRDIDKAGCYAVFIRLCAVRAEL